MSVTFRNLIGTLLFLFSITSFAEYQECGEIINAYGPYDYIDPNHFRNKLPVVEKHHFNSRVENLVGGHRQQTATAGGDLDYTLRAFPNHHRALNAMMRLSWKENRAKPIGSNFSIACWFDRAIRWRPEDGTVRMIFGNYLANSKVKRYQDAISQYEQAEKLLKNKSNLFYNMGLLYFHMKDYAKSREYAKKAYAAGIAFPALKDMLVRAGKWEG
jgi:tetratricopeptide (TPR) repeat protein